MAASKVLPLALGTLALASGTALVTLDVIFAVTLTQASSPAVLNITVIVASGIGSITVTLIGVLLGRHIRYRNGAALGHGRQQTYLLAGCGAVFSILSAVASALGLGMMQSRILEVPSQVLGTSTKALITAGFVVWAMAMLSQTIFVICMIIIQRKEFQRQIRRYSAAAPQQGVLEAEEKSGIQDQIYQMNAGYRGDSMDSKGPGSSGRSRSGSDTMSSIRSSFTQAVRPITSKTKLISPKSQRCASLSSNHHESIGAVEDGFDSWDYSSMDLNSRQTAEYTSSSPSLPRFLETIPASPTTSRSASPGCPLDLEPPAAHTRNKLHRHRSRSFSPSSLPSPSYPNTSATRLDLSRSYSPARSTRSRTATPIEESKEAHIHPLFRTDSPTPPPSATPGTIVHAAPGAGQVIIGSDRASIRSLSKSRMRSGSAPTSPLVHSASMDSIKRTMEEEEEEAMDDEKKEIERAMTPPIPQWILEAGSRSSLNGYHFRSSKRIEEAK
ncbi:hypothetical protein B0O99DRAFT_500365 [Bisporella sp. PMI_857]|nr:hypothetical protein B0O99DRAFT_500365 [Bisporella sp. PMI_857]